MSDDKKINTPYQPEKSFSDGHPVGSPVYRNYPELGISVSEHFRHSVEPIHPSNYNENNNDKRFFIDDHNKHYTRDVNDPDGSLKDKPVSYTNNDGSIETVFSGATTHINPTNDPDKQEIIEQTLSEVDDKNVKKLSGDDHMRPPISPIHPFTRMFPDTAQFANITTYNRTKLPIADLEFRKGFRHIFFTRPECYVMSRTDKNGNLTPSLCEQAEYDEDFSSCYTRMPHVIKMLAPIYVSGSFSQNGINSNWNYLLSNRVSSMSTATTTSMTIMENINKSIEGYTVTPAMHVESRQGSTLDFKFRDTKNLEVYEMLRMWMLYMYKRKKGIFSPPYNGYAYRNGFLNFNGQESMPVYTSTSSKNSEFRSITLHPYDRALEYCSSVYDIVTNESMTKILYWCKYYGVYPTSATLDGLSSENNNAITNEMSVSSTFKYHYKLECVNKTLVEFNYNAGITDDMGRINESVKKIETSHPFLFRDDPQNSVMKQYIGSAGMFTGSPYIIMMKTQNDPLNKTNSIVTPCLQFMSLDESIDSQLNMGIVNKQTESRHIIGTPISK